MLNPIQIIIQGTADFGRINEEFERLSKSSSGAFGAITKGAKALEIFASAFAVEKIVELAKEFSAEWINSAKSMAQLEAALRSTKQASAEYRQSLEEQRRAISAATGAEEDQLLVIQRHLVQYKASKDQIEDLTKLSLDLAASQGMDSTSAAMLLSRALGGEQVQLRGVRLEIDQTLPKYEQINSMIRQLNSQVGGQARAAFLSAAPEVTILNNELKETKKLAGEIITIFARDQARQLLDLKHLAEMTFNALVPDRVRGQAITLIDALSGKPGAGQNTTDDAAEKEAQRLHQQRMNLLGLQTAAGLAAAGEPAQQAMLESDRAFNEVRYALNKESLSKYLATRLSLIQREAEEERKILDASIAANSAAADKKMAELNAVKQGTDLQQIEKVQQEYDKLLIEGKKLASQLSALDTKTLTNLTNEGLFQKQNPTSFAGGAQKGWVDAVKDLGTVYENLATTIRNTVGTALSSVSQSVTGLIEGTTTWGKALQNIGTNVLNVVIEGLIRMFAAMVLGNQEVTTSELAKQAATIPGALVKMLATAVGEGGWAAVALIAAAVAALGVGVAAAAGAFAEGGRPEVGQVSLVGERGPELFVPDTAGTIIPAHVTSEILNGGSRRSAARAQSRQRPMIIHVHHWGDDKVRMDKYIQSTEGRHAVVEAVGKEQHVVLRT